MPGEAELIRQPAARTFFASLGKRLPEAVNLRLRLAFDHDGGALREGEGRSAVESRVDRPIEPERRVQQFAFRDRPVRFAADHAENLRIFEGGDVKSNGFLGPVAEGQAGRDLRPFLRLGALAWFSLGRHVPTPRRDSWIKSAAALLISGEEERAVLGSDSQSEGSETLNRSGGGNSTWRSLTRRGCGNA